MNNNSPHLPDRASAFTVLLTFILFGTALFIKGVTHDLLLEAGVFLVSVKLILMSYKQNVRAEVMQKTLDEMNDSLRQIRSQGRVP